MATARQIEANQKNALLSKGPRTALGKEQSRRNALRHGMAGAGVVLPEEDEALVASRVESWGRSLQPQNAREDWLVEQAALESVRIDRCVIRERVVLVEQSERAESSWDADRRLDAEKLAAKLARKPEIIRWQLQSTSQGCDLLIDRWEALLAALAPDTPWDEANRDKALDLLGVLREFREIRTKIDVKEGEDVVTIQSAVAVAEIDRLTIRKVEWLDDFDAKERDWAICGHAAPDAALNRVRRYETSCRRRLDAAIKELKLAHKGVTLSEKLRPTSTPPSEAPGPVAPASEFALLEQVPAESPFVNVLDPKVDLDAAITALTESPGFVPAPESSSVESTKPASAPMVPNVPAAPRGHKNRRQRQAEAKKARNTTG